METSLAGRRRGGPSRRTAAVTAGHGRLFLLPAGWTTADCAAIVLAGDDKFRVEFTRGHPPRPLDRQPDRVRATHGRAQVGVLPPLVAIQTGAGWVVGVAQQPGQQVLGPVVVVVVVQAFGLQVHQAAKVHMDSSSAPQYAAVLPR